jgi:hypothetical protein
MAMETIGAGIVDRSQNGPVGLGGWLLVFVVWAALMACVGIFVGLVFMLTPPSELDAVTAGFSFFLGLGLLTDAGLILLRKKLARTLSLTICGMLAAVCILTIVALVAGIIQVDLKTATQTARDLVLSSVWFLYFLRSRRVQNTLVV